MTETGITQRSELSPEQMLVLINSVDAVVWEAPAESDGFTFVSAQAERLLGYPISQWLSQPSFWADHLHPSDRTWCVENCDSKARAHQDHDLEYRMVAADGRTVWLRDIVKVIQELGQPTMLRGVMIDITARKEAAARLEEQEDQYRRIFEATTDGVVITDSETDRILAANPAFCSMHGYDDMTGMSARDFLSTTSLQVFEHKNYVVSKGEEFRGRAEHVHRNGTSFWVEVIGRAFSYDGRPAVLGIVRDISEQLRNEQAMELAVKERTQEIESLLRLANAIASTLDLDDLVRMILTDLRQVVEYSAASLILIEDGELVVHDVVFEGGIGKDASPARVRVPLSGPAHVGDAGSRVILDYPCVQVAQSDVFWTDLLTGNPVVVDDVLTSQSKIAVDYRGAVGPMLLTPELAFMRCWTAIPLQAQGRVIGYFGIASSTPGFITEKHIKLASAFADHASVALENARLYEQAQRLAAVEERQRLAQDLHDSVAQVLYGIALGAKTARKHLEGNPETVGEPVDYISSLAAAGLAEMRALIFDLQPDSISAEGLIKAIARQVDALETRHGLQVEVIISAEPDVSVEMKEAVYRVVREALHNVVKHAEASRVAITIETIGSRLDFRVADDGCGFQVNAEVPGHLGLTTMRSRVERMGGHFTISSSPGNGTLVTGSFPID